MHGEGLRETGPVGMARQWRETSGSPSAWGDVLSALARASDMLFSLSIPLSST
jgi:hypothetical protein